MPPSAQVTQEQGLPWSDWPSHWKVPREPFVVKSTDKEVKAQGDKMTDHRALYSKEAEGMSLQLFSFTQVALWKLNLPSYSSHVHICLENF
jgi:hypothetical protein